MRYVVHVNRVSLGYLEVDARSQKQAIDKAVEQAEKDPRSVEWVDHDIEPAAVELL